MSNFKQLYSNEIKKKMNDKFNYKNVSMIPKVEKIQDDIHRQ